MAVNSVEVFSGEFDQLSILLFSGDWAVIVSSGEWAVRICIARGFSAIEIVGAGMLVRPYAEVAVVSPGAFSWVAVSLAACVVLSDRRLSIDKLRCLAGAEEAKELEWNEEQNNPYGFDCYGVRSIPGNAAICE